MALKVAIELNVFEILAESSPPGTQLSTLQIVSKLPKPNPNQAVTSLYRILRFLSSHSFLTTSLPPESTLDEHEKLFGLTTLTANTMVRGDGTVLPMPALLLLFRTQKEVWESFEKLKFTVVNPEGSPAACPFGMAHGVGLYDYLAQRPNSEFTMVFDQLMGSSIKPFFDSVIRVYSGFEEVSELMDVGGNHGSALQHIISIYPNILRAALILTCPMSLVELLPSKHVAGDMFEALPSSKTIMLKWILHNWSDEECVKLLRNCWKALPEEGGKVIVLELVIPDDLERSEDTMAVTMDLHMLVMFGNGKERTVYEFRNLAAMAGFSSVNVVPAKNGIHVLEFFK